MVQSIAYFTGFETGDTSELTVESGTGTAQTTTKRTGGYAFKSATGAAASVNFIGGLSVTSAVARVYFQFTSATPAGDGLIVDFDDAVTPVFIGMNASKQLFIRDSAVAVTTGTTVLSTGTWYRIEFVFNTTGVLRCYLNGALEVDTTESGAGITAQRFRFNGDSSSDCYLDDVRLDTGGNTLIGAGQCIARQGVAGTPTYDAWTKNGAATAALCWSETPFATGKNCSDSVLNDAQTMLVGSFTTDPGRSVEGTQIVGVNDTVNAIKVGMIAKTAVIGNINLRRRVGGTNTDTVVALTTSDAYYQTAFFTDTVANLNAYEIGVKNALVATAETVEDMWLFVDYTPGTSEPDVALPQEQGQTLVVFRRAPVMIAY